jgi:hypothetical protein
MKLFFICKNFVSGSSLMPALIEHSKPDRAKNGSTEQVFRQAAKDQGQVIITLNRLQNVSQKGVVGRLQSYKLPVRPPSTGMLTPLI